MKKVDILLLLSFFSLELSAQIDGNLFVGLTPIANVDMGNITINKLR